MRALRRLPASSPGFARTPVFLRESFGDGGLENAPPLVHGVSLRSSVISGPTLPRQTRRTRSYGSCRYEKKRALSRTPYPSVVGNEGRAERVRYPCYRLPELPASGPPAISLVAC